MCIRDRGLLVQSFFKKKDYYPKAFFDLKGRILENDEILQFFGVLVECKSLLFGGFIEEKTEEKKELRMIDASIPVSYTHLDVYKRQFLVWTMPELLHKLK